MAIYHHTTRMIGRSKGGNPVRALAYITGAALSDPETGEIFNYQDKSIQDVQVFLPSNAPLWARELQELVKVDKDKGLQLLSDIANAAEKRCDAQVYREIEFSLPRELTFEQNRQLAHEYVQDQFCGLGMTTILSFHLERCEETGRLNPHAHVFFLTRELVEDGLALKKNRDWNERSLHGQWREQWAQYANFHLKMHGHDITLDHRSYKDQGIDIEPQVKLGKGIKEQEKRARGSGEPNKGKQAQELGEEGSGGYRSPSLKTGGFLESEPATDRVKDFRDVQLRNLYRILRRPETVFDIVTRHHATFMWGDVQKILGRYVDDAELFQRVEGRLKNSSDLILLKADGVSGLENPGPEIRLGEKVANVSTTKSMDKSIYTTRAMLKAEKSLVSVAEGLSLNGSHPVSQTSLEQGMGRLGGRLETKGFSLSEDQDKAIRHLVSQGQLKCIVGYAGAGKTTALEVASEIWEEAGYRVYGLAPTGRAAKNLEDSGISSQTLHKFLKAFEEGRSQYSDKSVIVLDEAGMVDVERFEAFLGAVKTLGVKAVVVGDGAQLQPVEAGPAFRLVTERVGVSRLEEVVRQKENWQREATVLFGKQETKSAIQEYQLRGHIHLVEETLRVPPLKDAGIMPSAFSCQRSMGPLSEGALSSGSLDKNSADKGSLDKGGHGQEILYQETLRSSTLGAPEDYRQDVVRHYEIAARTSGLIFREIMKDVRDAHPHETNTYSLASKHEDFAQFLKWREIQKETAQEILGNVEVYKPILELRRLDPFKMATLVVSQDKVSRNTVSGDTVSQDKTAGASSQHQDAVSFLKEKGLDHLIGVERVPGTTVEVRSGAKAALIEGWMREFKELIPHKPQKSLLMMAYSNRDVRDLNSQARGHLKSLGVIEKAECAYKITQEVEDDFGRKKKFHPIRSFSKGDRIVFTRNKQDLDVSNGSMGTILSLSKDKIEVRLDGDKTLSFSPHMFPFFDQGWAVTIHKSQGTTVDKSFLLLSHEMTQNLTYVAMTRHREDVSVYGSTLDFWRPEKVADVLSKSGEKLGAADYLDVKSLASLMKDEDRFLSKLFTRLGDELHAMGVVSKQAVKSLADHFLGIIPTGMIPIGIVPKGLGPGRASERDIEHDVEKSMRLNLESLKLGPIREEERAHELLKKAPRAFKSGPGNETGMQEAPGPQYNNLEQLKLKINHTLKDVYEDWKHPAFKKADHYKRVFEEGMKLHGEHAAIEYWQSKRESFINFHEEKVKAVEKELQAPILSYLSIESRNLALKAAFEDPDKALNRILQLQASKTAEQLEKERSSQTQSIASQKNVPHTSRADCSPSRDQELRDSSAAHFRFRDLSYELEQKPHNQDLIKEMSEIGRRLFKDKSGFEHIEAIDPKIAKLIKQFGQEKNTASELQKVNELEKENDYGGYSM